MNLEKNQLLEDILETCGRLDRGPRIHPAERPTYISFLERQLEIYKPKKKKSATKSNGSAQDAFVSFMADTLLLFSYLIGKTAIVESDVSETKVTLNKENLGLLRVRGSQVYLWDDKELFRLYDRRKTANKHYGYQTYVELIDSVGSDPEVVKHWGKPIVYKEDIGGRTYRAASRAINSGPKPGKADECGSWITEKYGSRR